MDFEEFAPLLNDPLIPPPNPPLDDPPIAPAAF